MKLFNCLFRGIFECSLFIFSFKKRGVYWSTHQTFWPVFIIIYLCGLRNYGYISVIFVVRSFIYASGCKTATLFGVGYLLGCSAAVFGTIEDLIVTLHPSVIIEEAAMSMKCSQSLYLKAVYSLTSKQPNCLLV